MLTQNRKCSAQSLGVLVSVRFLHIFPFHSPFLLWPLRLWRTVFVFLCQALFRLRVDVMIVGVRASVCGYGKDSAFALRDFGARIFTGGGWRGLCLSSPWSWCSMLSAECDHLRRATSTSSLWTTIDFSFIGKTCHFDEKLAKLHISRSNQQWCADLPAGGVPGQRRTENPS